MLDACVKRHAYLHAWMDQNNSHVLLTPMSFCVVRTFTSVVTAVTEKTLNRGPGNWCPDFGPPNKIRTSRWPVLAAKFWALDWF